MAKTTNGDDAAPENMTDKQHVQEGTTWTPFGIHWKRERQAEFTRLMHELPVLQEVPEKTVSYPLTAADSWQHPSHLLIEGDNLYSLVALMYAYWRRVHLIAIDPPYNTKSADISYADHHSQWMEFMDIRLRAAKEMLAPGGIIMVFIDDNEHAALKLLMDDIFTEECFVGEITRRTRTVDNSSRNGFSQDHDYILIYGENTNVKLVGVAKEEGSYTNPDNDPRGAWASHLLSKSHTKAQRPGGYYLIPMPDGFVYPASQSRVWAYRDTCEHCGTAEKCVGERKTGGKACVKQLILDGKILGPEYDPAQLAAMPKMVKDRKYQAIELSMSQHGWPVIEDKLHADLHRSKDLLWGHDGKYWRIPSADISAMRVGKKASLSYKRHRSELRSDYTPLKSFLDGHLNSGGTKALNAILGPGYAFTFPKPVSLMKLLCSQVDDPEAVILDFFAGSGTTGQAVLELNKEDGGRRQFILCTNNEGNICEGVTYPRLKKVMEGFDGFDALGGTMRYMKSEDCFLEQGGSRDQMLRELARHSVDTLRLRYHAMTPLHTVMREKTGEDDGDRLLWGVWRGQHGGKSQYLAIAIPPLKRARAAVRQQMIDYLETVVGQDDELAVYDISQAIPSEEDRKAYTELQGKVHTFHLDNMPDEIASLRDRFIKPSARKPS